MEYYLLACNCYYYTTVDNIDALHMIQKGGPRGIGQENFKIWTQKNHIFHDKKENYC
jgi:hypothetical protein